MRSPQHAAVAFAAISALVVPAAAGDTPVPSTASPAVPSYLLAAPPVPELHRAIQAGEPARWRSLLARKTDLSVRDHAGNTALHFAALRHDLEAVEALLVAGADPSARNTADATPLLYGAGHAGIVRALLARGAEVNAASKAQVTPLMAASAHPESYDAVRLLLEAGADIRATRRTEREAMLTRAIVAGDRRTITLLLENGADPNPKAGFTPLMNAAVIGDAETVRLLVARGASLDQDSEFAGHSLNLALYADQPEIARYLLAAGASPTFASTLGPRTPPMVWAAYNTAGDATLARALHAAGVDLNAADAEGATALSYALRNGADTPLVRYLRGAGAREPAAPRAKTIPQHPVPDTPAERAAVIRSRLPATLALLARSSQVFLENKFVQRARCSSCHQQDLPAVAFDLARGRGFDVPEPELARMLHARLAMWTPAAERGRQMTEPLPDFPVSLGYGLFGLHALGYAPDEMTDGLVHHLLRIQRPDGSWPVYDMRPPMEDGMLVGAAWGAFALRHYPPAGRERERDAALRRVLRWTESREPRWHNERVFKLLALVWAGASRAALRSEVASLQAAQRADGGWAQLAGLESDAWATGSTMFALAQAGVATAHESYQRGVAFLLRTQFDDGSWWVRSRSWPFQPHFDSQFPHGKDQWISAAGTAWAAIALLETLPAANSRSIPAPRSLLARYPRETPAAVKPAQIEATATNPTASGRPPPDYTRDIRPLLERSCAGCHGEDKPRANFNVSNHATLLKGGASGEPAIVAGDVRASVLVAYVTDKVEDLEMPPLNRREKYPALTPAEVDLLRRWIEAGAPESR